MPDFRTVKLVAAKELLEALRDRRTLFVALVLPVLLYPAVIGGMNRMESQRSEELRAQALTVAVDGSIAVTAAPGTTARSAGSTRLAVPCCARSSSARACRRSTRRATSTSSPP